MAREVKWAEIAWKDLEEAADCIAKDSPYYAASFIKNARDAARVLQNFMVLLTLNSRKISSQKTGNSTLK